MRSCLNSVGTTTSLSKSREDSMQSAAVFCSSPGSAMTPAAIMTPASLNFAMADESADKRLSCLNFAGTTTSSSDSREDSMQSAAVVCSSPGSAMTPAAIKPLATLNFVMAEESTDRMLSCLNSVGPMTSLAKSRGCHTGGEEPEQEVMPVGAMATEFFRIHDRSVGVQAVPRSQTRASQASVTTKHKGCQTMGRHKGGQT